MIKKTFIVIIAIVSVICLGLDAWYLSVYLHGADKTVSQTFKVGLQTLTDGTAKSLAEIQLFKNSNNNGLKTFEFKWNYILDEDRTAFFSQGTQVIGDFGVAYQYDKSTEIKTDNGKHAWMREEYFKYGGRFIPNSNCKTYDYASGNNFEVTTFTTNSINDDTLFKITLNINGKDEIYGMKFKGANGYRNALGFTSEYVGEWKMNVRSQRGTFNQIDAWTSYYYYYDYIWFMNLMYESIQGLEPGVDQNIVFEFGNYFDYYEYDAEHSAYAKMSVDTSKADLISSYIKSYYVIRVKVNEGGLQKSSDSLFKSVMGQNNYNSTGNYDEENYFVGRTVITANWNNFVYVELGENNYALKLKQRFIDYYLQYKDLIRLNVVIDLDALSSKNMNFVGFTEDSGLSTFVIQKCVTRQTINGQVVESEVAYV